LAQFKYQIHRIEVVPGADLDAQIEKVLSEYGMKGWELVQILHRDKVSDDPTYGLIFKREKSEVGW
jgi:hypothetical protein